MESFYDNKTSKMQLEMPLNENGSPTRMNRYGILSSDGRDSMRDKFQTFLEHNFALLHLSFRFHTVGVVCTLMKITATRMDCTGQHV